jgi:hypothetical protein
MDGKWVKHCFQKLDKVTDALINHANMKDYCNHLNLHQATEMILLAIMYSNEHRH